MSGSSLIAGVVLLLLLFLASVLAAVAWIRARSLQVELDEAMRQARGSGGERAPARVSRTVVESIAHELRSPMTGIMGHQELLEEGLYGDMDERCHQAVVRIGEGARELLHLLDGTLDLARIDGGSLELQKDAVSGAEIASEAVEFAKRLSAERATELEARIDEDLPRVGSDRARLARAVHLALTAAIRSAPGGHLRLNVESDDDVAIRVSVTGTGLSPDALGGDADGEAGGEAGGAADDAEAARAELRAALSPASAAQDADSAAAGSVGPRALGSSWLRLTIARTLARRLGGDLRIEAADEGTRLTLRIPVKPAVASEELENPGEAPEGRR